MLSFEQFVARLPDQWRNERHWVAGLEHHITLGWYFVATNWRDPITVNVARAYQALRQHMLPGSYPGDILRPLLIATARIRGRERQYFIDGAQRVGAAYHQQVPLVSAYILTLQETLLICPALLTLAQPQTRMTDQNAIDPFEQFDEFYEP